MLDRGDIRLDSWKEIAEFLRVDVRTARRWEKQRALPVRRVPGGGRSTLYAYISEIENWLQSGNKLPPGSTDQAQTSDSVVDESDRSAQGVARLRSRWGSKSWALKFAALGVAAVMLPAVFSIRFGSPSAHNALAQFVAALGRRTSSVTRIEKVSPIYAETNQTVVIRGRGFGSRPQVIRTDHLGGMDTIAGNNQTSLVIANIGQDAHRWTAGRASEVNMCEIGIRLEEWSDTQIVISGFSGPLGAGCGEKYQIAAGDHVEIGVFGPRNQCGPGGISNCLDEIRVGHVSVFQTEVLAPATAGRRCP